MLKDKIVNEILNERERQDRKWGIQNHPCVPSNITALNIHKVYRLPSEKEAKDMCENAFRMGNGTWGHIALEEFVEALCAPTEELRRAELVQLAAVIVANIENIDRNKAKEAAV